MQLSYWDCLTSTVQTNKIKSLELLHQKKKNALIGKKKKKPETNKPAICRADMSEEALSLEVLTGQTYIKQMPFIITVKVTHLNLKCPSLEE